MNLPEHAAFALAVMLVAGLLKGLVGVGMPTVAVGLLGVVMAPMYAAALIVLPTFVSNLWQALTGPLLRPLIARLWPLLVMTALGTWVCAGIITRPPQRTDKIWLGLVLVAYSAIALSRWQPRVPRHLEQLGTVLAGVTTGLTNGVTGTAVVPAVPFMASLGLGREGLVQAVGLLALTSTGSLGLMLGMTGMIDGPQAQLSMLLLVPAVGGVIVGARFRGRLSEDVFRRVFLLFQGALGAYLIYAGM